MKTIKTLEDVRNASAARAYPGMFSIVDHALALAVFPTRQHEVTAREYMNLANRAWREQDQHAAGYWLRMVASMILDARAK